jgi:hypothetical protein
MLNKFKRIQKLKLKKMIKAIPKILIAASCYFNKEKFNNIFITDFLKFLFFILSGVVMDFLIFRISSLNKMISGFIFSCYKINFELK